MSQEGRQIAIKQEYHLLAWKERLIFREKGRGKREK
jgi:hypothetical protein